MPNTLLSKLGMGSHGLLWVYDVAWRTINTHFIQVTDSIHSCPLRGGRNCVDSLPWTDMDFKRQGFGKMFPAMAGRKRTAVCHVLETWQGRVSWASVFCLGSLEIRLKTFKASKNWDILIHGIHRSSSQLFSILSSNPSHTLNDLNTEEHPCTHTCPDKLRRAETESAELAPENVWTLSLLPLVSSNSFNYNIAFTASTYILCLAD